MGVLNTINKFALPAAAQLILNICVIIALFLGAFWFPSTAYTMAWATFLGGVLQVAILWINVKYCGFKIWFDISPVMEEVKLFFKKLISGAVGAGVWQLNVIIDFIVLSFLPTGSVSYFYYTDHVNQLPIGILGIAFSTALLPPITRAIAAKNNEMAQKQMNFGLLFAFIFTLPSAILFISLSEPIIAALYGGGNFGPEQVAIAAPTLEAFAIGLPAYMATKVFTTTFFAHKNTQIPLIGGIISIVTNLLFIVIFMPTMKHTGIALATSLSSWCNVIYLLCCLHKLGTINVSMDTAKECLKQLIACIVMLLAVMGMNAFANYRYYNEPCERNVTLLIVVSISVLVFYAIGRVFGIFKFFGVVESLDKKDEKLS
jgi:putative peptidoglycan lipid II flippase